MSAWLWRVLLLATLCAILAACAGEGGDRSDRVYPQVGVHRSPPAATAILLPSRRVGRGFARLPDRGEFIAYPGNVVRQDGAYRWHRVDMSETHALRAVADGRLRVTTPAGEVLDIRYDRHIEHPSGDWTWIGHLPGQEGVQTILTFGAEAAFGSIARPGKLPLRLTVRDGVSWLVETDPAQVAAIINAATRPRKRDYHVVPRAELPNRGRVRAAATPVKALSATTAATATAANTIDLIVGYTAGFANANGGASGAMTRLNFLVDVANAAYQNSQVAAEVRLVRAMQVTYPDTNTNDLALEQLSGYRSGSGPVTPNSAFNALRAARETYGADLVLLMRKFQDPEQEGCGIAWLLGGSKQGIGAGEGWDELGYSVVGDGRDQGTDGKTYYCRDETTAHELGHNMGSAHDRATSMGDDGVLDDPDDYGAYAYSFGYQTTTTTGNFFTIMAYGDSGQISYRVFSNPRITYCGGRACGTFTWEDNARSLTQTLPVVATFRATVVPTGTPVRSDFDGDGNSDALWHNSSTGAGSIWKAANSTTQVALTTVANTAWKIVGTGDFDGDGNSDVAWRNSSDGRNAIWRSGNSATQLFVSSVTTLAWKIVGVGDFDGDGRADLLWRHSSDGRNVVWKSGNSLTSQAVTRVSDLNWKVVGVGDFDGDGRSDVLWRNFSSGANVIWKSANANSSQSVTTQTNKAWTVVGIGDFDADGRSDIVWRNGSDGRNAIWRSGSSAMLQPVTTVANRAWKVAAIGDFNGDGQSDILWRNSSTGANVIWRSANSANTQAVTAVASQAWSVAA